LSFSEKREDADLAVEMSQEQTDLLEDDSRRELGELEEELGEGTRTFGILSVEVSSRDFSER